MHQPNAHNFPATQSTIPATSLPWEWFDFPVLPEFTPTDGTIPRTQAIQIDSRSIPYRILQRASASQKPRPALLMLHGMGLTIASFRGVAGYLLPTHDLILPDYSSFSLPTSGLDSLTMKSFARSVFRIADALHLDRISLAGNSLGGGLSLMAALQHPDRVDKILLSNPACFPQQLPQMYRIARIPLIGELLMSLTSPEDLVAGLQYIGYVDEARFEPELRSRYLALLRPRQNRFRLMSIIRRLPAHAGDFLAAPHVPKLSTLKTPVLISWGGQDPLLTEGAGERLAQALPNTRFDRHGDLAHLPHEECPERIGPDWSRFLNQ